MSRRVIGLLVVLIFLSAIFIRLYRLDLNFPNLYSDEVELHYKASALIELPQLSLFSASYNYLFYRTYTYTWLFGLNPLGVRLPVAVYISISVLLIYFFARHVAKIRKDNMVAVPLLTMLLSAVLPWSFMMSRIGFTQIAIMLMFVLFHLILYLRANNFKSYLISLIPLLLSAYYYQSMIVMTPFILLLIFLQIRKFVSKKQIAIYIMVAVTFLLSLSAIFFLKPNYSHGSFGSRGLDLAIWKDPNVTAETNLYRGLSRSSLPTIFSFGLSSESIGNKLTYGYSAAVLDKFVKNYVSFLSFDFLFLQGDQTLRHSTGQVGEFFPFLLPFMAYGVFVFFQSKNTKIKLAFLVWIFAMPIATSLTTDGYKNLIRVIAMMPFLTYLSALGVVESVKLFNRKLRLYYCLILILVGLYSAYSFFFGYFHVYPTLAAKEFDYGFKELSDFQIQNSSQSMLVIWDGYYPHYHFRFWQDTPGADYLIFNPSDIKDGQTVFHKMCNNLYFSLPFSQEDLNNFIKKNNVAYIAVPEILVSQRYGFLVTDYNMLDKVYYPDNSIAFYILVPKINE